MTDRPSSILPDHRAYDVDAHLKRVKEIHASYALNNSEACEKHTIGLLRRIVDLDRCPDQLLESWKVFIDKLYEDNDFYIPRCHDLRLPNYLSRLEHRMTDPVLLEAADRAVRQFFRKFTQALPRAAYAPIAAHEQLTVPLIDLLVEPRECIALCVLELFSAKLGDELIFRDLHSTMFDNFITASGYETETYKGQKLTPLWEYKGSAQQVALAYLSRTPCLDLFAEAVPFEIPQDIRFEHTWITAGSGHGKTNALTAMILDEIPNILKGEASVILIDSQNAIIPGLERLKVFEGTERLLVIDPAEPVALNPFDIGLDQIHDEDERADRLAVALDMLSFIFGSLNDQPLTGLQRTLFEYTCDFLITAVPNANILDFRDLLDVKTAGNYDQYKPQASDEVRNYLESDFVENRFTRDNRANILSRLRPMLRRPTFNRMFAAPRTRLHLGEEINKGKLILIATDKNRLGSYGTKLYGRFWITQIALAAQARGAGGKKLPTYFYIDEAHDYLAGGDPKIEDILGQARKQNIGLAIIHHTTTQLKSPELVSLLTASTSTKMCAAPDLSDLARFASVLQCDASFIQRQPKGSFATMVRGVTNSAISLEFPYIDLPKQPQMSEESRLVIRAANAQRYGAERATRDRTVSSAEPRSTPPPLPEQPDTSPSPDKDDKNRWS